MVRVHYYPPKKDSVTNIIVTEFFLYKNLKQIHVCRFFLKSKEVFVFCLSQSSLKRAYSRSRPAFFIRFELARHHLQVANGQCPGLGPEALLVHLYIHPPGKNQPLTAPGPGW